MAENRKASIGFLFQAGSEARGGVTRLQKEAGADTQKQVERAYQLALGRVPTVFERAKSVAFIQSSPHGLAEFCQALFNLNEFVYRQ